MEYRPYCWMGEDADAHIQDWLKNRCLYCERHHDSRLACREWFEGPFRVVDMPDNMSITQTFQMQSILVRECDLNQTATGISMQAARQEAIYQRELAQINA